MVAASGEEAQRLAEARREVISRAHRLLAARASALSEPGGAAPPDLHLNAHSGHWWEAAGGGGGASEARVGGAVAAEAQSSVSGGGVVAASEGMLDWQEGIVRYAGGLADAGTGPVCAVLSLSLAALTPCVCVRVCE